MRYYYHYEQSMLYHLPLCHPVLFNTLSERTAPQAKSDKNGVDDDVVGDDPSEDGGDVPCVLVFYSDSSADYDPPQLS